MSESRPIEVGYRVPPTTPRPGPTVRARVTAIGPEGSRSKRDTLVTEEPCEILVEHRGGQHPVAVTMRTPGNDFELAAGFLFTEGMMRGHTDLRKVSYCASGPPEQLYNQVTVELTDDAPFDAARMSRNVFTSSSCGVCGKGSLEAVRVSCARVADGPVIDDDVVHTLPDRLRDAQAVFASTGGLHAAGLFSTDGEPIVVREDVGRHNAVDKVVGALLMADELPASERILQVSGRASFEIVQKAGVAGIPIVSAVSAPSSLAVDLADELGMTLLGFVRGGSFNVYAGPSRIRSTAAS